MDTNRIALYVMSKRLIQGMEKSVIDKGKNPNSFPVFCGKNEMIDHRGYYEYLRSQVGQDLLDKIEADNEHISIKP